MRTNSRCARTLNFKTDKCNFTVGDDTLSVNKFFERMVMLSVLAFSECAPSFRYTLLVGY